MTPPTTAPTRPTDQVPTPSSARRTGRRRWVIAAAVFALLALLSALLIVNRVSSSDGWQPVWSDDFSGAAKSAPSAANWQLDTGTSYPGGAAQWGTGEIQSYTTDRANAQLDG